MIFILIFFGFKDVSGSAECSAIDEGDLATRVIVTSDYDGVLRVFFRTL